jgi:hypothetical protein
MTFSTQLMAASPIERKGATIPPPDQRRSYS